MKKFLRILKHQKDLLISIMPAIIFMLVYNSISFRIAIIVGLVIGTLVYAISFYYHKNLTPLNILGIIGLLASSFLGFITDNPRTVFVYPIVSGLIYATIFIGSYFTKFDVISIVARGFYESEVIFDQCRPSLRRLTLLWGGFYLIKVGLKLFILRSTTSIELIYGLNWIMGYPLTILMTFVSFKYPDRYYFRAVYPTLSEEERPVFLSEDN